jgi:hypothetical protein
MNQYPNMKDFTPPEHYREMDRLARYYRKERIVVNILLWVAWFASVVTALKLIFIR